MTFDRIFKTALLTLLLILVWIGWTLGENGRYVYHPKTEHEGARVIDTRTGVVFEMDELQATIEFHPVSGEAILRKTRIGEDHTTTPSSATALVVPVAVVSLGALAVAIKFGKKKVLNRRKAQQQSFAVPRPSPSRKPNPETFSAKGQALWQNLLVKVLHDEHKAVRLIQFEHDELSRKGLPDEDMESLMARAIARWERDNAG